MPYLLNASHMMQTRNKGRILRICWETNGAMSKGMLADMAEVEFDHLGQRSEIALRILRTQGYTEAKHLAGGILAWRAAGLPTTR